ncbi:PEP-CTERM sorting domain-containing protein [Marinobacter halotolerans]|uniref:PEP-CTERM sorting domain-containing protein n=1 Tax=Marinobacter halotolerans TaxID=1569211 RepID=UPI00178302A4|nr:PEP-CTERM sorting domain-containing protein [Marinobacter halotolerans]
MLFDNNSLTNSGDADNDLHIFEIGPDVEDTFVAIRPTADTLSLLGAFSGLEINDGFFSIGKVFGATSSLDIDSVFGGFGAGQLRFDAVQLIDDIDEGASSGSTVGADIDAVGAIFSAPPVPREVPEPGSLALLAGGLLLSSVFRLARGRSQDR